MEQDNIPYGRARGGIATTGNAVFIALVTILTVAATLWLPSDTAAKDREAVEKAIRRAGQVSRAETPALGQGDLYALVVGVSKYQHHPKVPSLNLSCADAKGFAEFLQTQAKVFKNIHVTLLLDEQATKMTLEKYLNYELPKAGKDDTVILFFSGHGSGDVSRPGDYYFLTYDADPDYLEATAVKMSGLGFLKRQDARRVLLVADACHAGAFSQIRTKGVESPLTLLMKELRESSGLAFMTSSKPTESSQEKPGLTNSVFTHYLLKGLRGEADADRNAVVTLQELYDYVYERTKGETAGAQHPQLERSGEGKMPLAVLGTLEDSAQLEMWVIAQDPRCTDRNCIDPPSDAAVCNDPLCQDQGITDGATMHLGQNYQIAFRPSTTGYVYVYQVDAKGDVYKLFPGDEFTPQDNRMNNPLKGGEIYWIPSKNAWLRHGGQEGKEKIYVVASRSRNKVLEDLYAEIHGMRARTEAGANLVQAAQGDLEIYLKSMAPANVQVKKAKSPKDVTVVGIEPGKSHELACHVIDSCELDAAKSVWFWLKQK
ncbi:MAG: caspase family protein [Desulfomonile tiedjei]|nr:caspase family protein [Desulfomonile tiedjei]